MALFSKQKILEERVLILDIGSGSIGAAYLVRQKGMGSAGNPKILHTVRKNIPLLADLDFIPLVQNMLGTVDFVVKEMQHAHLPAPDKIECILAAPWYAASTRIVREKRRAPFVFTKKLWYELLLKEVSDFRQSFLEQFQDIDGIIDREPRVIEKKNMHVALNGYTVADPIGKRASELEMSIYISMVPEYIALSLEEIIGIYFKQEITLGTFLGASFQVMRDIFISEHDYVLLDIGGEITDMGFVKNDILSETATFPRGKNFILRRIMHHAKVSREEASSLFSLYLDSKLTDRMKSVLLPVLTRAKADWTQMFSHTLGEILSDFTIPKTIILTCDDDVSNFFIEAIHDEQFTQSKLSTRHFNVIMIKVKDLHEFCSLDRTVSHDPFMMLESIYVSKQK